MLEEQATGELSVGLRVSPHGRLKLYDSPAEMWFSAIISTQPVRDPCTRAESSFSCESFVRHLEPRDIIAYETLGGGMRMWSDASEGIHTTIAGREARIRSEFPGGCDLIGGEQTVNIWIRDGERGDWYAVLIACLRGPDLPAREAELMELLQAAEHTR